MRSGPPLRTRTIGVIILTVDIGFLLLLLNDWFIVSAAGVAVLAAAAGFTVAVVVAGVYGRVQFVAARRWVHDARSRRGWQRAARGVPDGVTRAWWMVDTLESMLPGSAGDGDIRVSVAYTTAVHRLRAMMEGTRPPRAQWDHLALLRQAPAHTPPFQRRATTGRR